jgi:uncharacterized membrane protein
MDSLWFHPKLVHLPMGLGVLMPLVALGLVLAWWRGWLPRRSWVIAIALQAVLAGSAFVAMRTGEAEEDRVEEVVGRDLVHEHEEAGELLFYASLGVLALMVVAGALGARRAALPLAVVAALGTCLVLVATYRTGEAGGSLIYRHGGGAAYPAQR